MRESTPDQIRGYIEQCQVDEKHAEFGFAMKWVEDMKMGIWGNNDALQEDAAEMLLFEVKKLASKNGLFLFRVTPEHIRRTKAFKEAFDFARQKNKMQTAAALIAQADLVGGTELKASAQYDYDQAMKATPVNLLTTHERIYQELKLVATPSRKRSMAR